MTTDPDPVIAARDLFRNYGRRRKRVEAVRGVSVTVGRGEIFGLIGPDGAGKTSVIQMLAGVLVPQRGDVSIAGIDAVRDPEAVKRRVGYMPQGLGVNLYDSLTVDENIDFFRRLRQLPNALYRQNRADLLAMTRLEPFLDRRAGNLSGGMRQKLALICTLIHLPDVLLLDEPTTGVDPISRQDFWEIIRRVVDERRATVLLSTSYMDEAERCHRIALMHAGTIVAEGTPDSVRARTTGRYAAVTADPQQDALALLRNRSDVSSTEVFGEAIHIRFDGHLRAIEAGLVARGIAIRDLSMEEPDLDDVFLELLSGSARVTPSFHFAPVGWPSAAATIECHGATRRFDAFAAVDHVDLVVERGEIFGLLGPNGAGKTTLIKMMCGLLAPSAGTISVAGVNVTAGRERVWTGIGYMSQRFSLYRDLSVRQNLRLYSDLYGVDARTCADMTTRMGLDGFAARLAGDLPTGVRQRLSLLCAVLHRPPIVFLDEPTSGVDPQARRLFWDLIYSLSRESGVTILVSTHYMDEAEHCDRLGLMDAGRLIAVGRPAALKDASERESGRLLAIRAPDLRAAHAVLAGAHRDATIFGDRIRLRSVDPDADRPALLELFARAGVGPARIDVMPLSMDDTFVDFIRRGERVHG